MNHFILSTLNCNQNKILKGYNAISQNKRANLQKCQTIGDYCKNFPILYVRIYIYVVLIYS